MRTILHTKIFDSNSEFVDFQKDNEDIGITQIIPVMTEVKSNDENNSAKVLIKIFIVFFYKGNA